MFTAHETYAAKNGYIVPFRMDSPYMRNIFLAIRHFDDSSRGRDKTKVKKQVENRLLHSLEDRLGLLADRFRGDFPFLSFGWCTLEDGTAVLNLREVFMEDILWRCTRILVLNLYHYATTFGRIKLFAFVAKVDRN